jgi:predicted outer membrane protein
MDKLNPAIEAVMHRRIPQVIAFPVQCLSYFPPHSKLFARGAISRSDAMVALAVFAVCACICGGATRLHRERLVGHVQADRKPVSQARSAAGEIGGCDSGGLETDLAPRWFRSANFFPALDASSCYRFQCWHKLKRAADRAFMEMAARANMTEAHIGQMAETQAAESQVKDFGQTLIHDHTDAYTQLTALAAKTGESIPKGINVRKISTVEQLMKLQGKRFDHQFVQAEIRDPEKAIADFRREAQHGQDPDVKAYASKMIPVLEGHMRQAKALAKPVEPRSSQHSFFVRNWSYCSGCGPLLSNRRGRSEFTLRSDTYGAIKSHRRAAGTHPQRGHQNGQLLAG